MPDETPPPEETPQETPPQEETPGEVVPVEVEEHKEENFATWTKEEKEKLFNQLNEFGEFINGTKTRKQEQSQQQPPAPAEQPPAPAPKKRGLRFKRKS